ncbi:MAG TPA: PP2C family protein-serine/threonine phosphatase [Candidatus Dormibacteraeota bacterium]|jgi:serine/threonine protein phosphatase PrpC|nr:PP2C family protein-serine/threonine phosphatase [Candidatus Dormibacteraeota bacterium]
MPIDAAVREAQGPRTEMEDSHVLQVVGEDLAGAVFDGHFGPEVAAYAARNYAFEPGLEPGAALLRIHQGTHHLRDGACAVAFCLESGRLRVANAGDAELALVRDDQVEVVTQVHRISNRSERLRILAAGGVIDGPYAIDPRTGDGLMPTRGLGDHVFGRIGIVCEPATWEGVFDRGWLVAACDGLWDVLRAAELPRFLKGTADDVAASLVREAISGRGSGDNVTVLVAHRT